MAAAVGLAVLGWAISVVWTRAGLPLGTFRPGLGGHGPDPHAWPRLYAVWLPVGYAGFSLIHWHLARACRLSSRYRRLDGLTYLLLPGFLGLETLAPRLGDWTIWLGGAYLLLVLLKTGILLRAVFVGLVAPEAATAGTAAGSLVRALFATALLVYGLTAAYLVTAISTTGDEPYYLLVTVSLLRDRDLDLANNFARRDYLPFYWGSLYREQNTVETATGALYSVTYSGLLAYLLLPGYAVGGRLGATFTIGLFAALLMVQVFRLGWEATGSVRAAFLTWVALAFSAPVLFFAAQIYPEIPAALAVAYAIRAIARLPENPGRQIGLALALASLPLLKLRYAGLALTLGALAVGRLRGWRAILLGLAGAATLALACLAADAYFGGLLYARYLGRIPLLHILTPRPRMLAALLGIFVDQEFGLLPYAPVYTLALVGIPFALRRDRLALPLLGVGLAYAYPFLHAAEWYGGFSLPFRYFVSTIPILGLFVAHALAHARGAALATFTGAAWLWSLAVAALLTLRPLLRYNQGSGEAAWLRAVGEALGADLPRVFPTAVNRSAETLWLVLIGAIVLLSAIGWALRGARPARSGDGPGRAFTVGTGLLALLVFLAAGTILVGAARGLPTFEVQGEHMEPSGRGVFFPGHDALPFKAWVMRSNGTVSKTIRLGDGPRILAVVAGAYSTEGDPAHLVVSLDGRPIGEIDVAAGVGQWRTGRYAFTLPPSRGRHRLTLAFTNAAEDRATGRVRHLLIDRITIERPP